MEKINVAELLKNCPSGMELDCTMWDNLYFDRVEDDLIHCYYELDGFRNTTFFLKDGCYTSHKLSKCVIFPKGKTSWEGFVPPREFKDGDICCVKTEAFEHIFIFKVSEDSNYIHKYANLCEYKLYTDESQVPVCHTNCVRKMYLATEEQKQKLFDAIKANGYKWNPKTKSLEKLPKFKVGDTIKNKNDKWLATRTIQSYVVGIGYFTTVNDWVRIEDQDDYELVSDIKPKFKVGDRIVHSENGGKKLTINGVYKTLYGIEEFDYGIPIENQDEYELVPGKFDINTLVPLESKVLVRDCDDGMWKPTFWGKDLEDSNYRYLTSSGYYKQCVPYECNEHLLGTTNDCDEFYKNWE